MLLAYCILKQPDLPAELPLGLDAAPTETLSFNGLACVYSALDRDRVSEARADALVFHSAIQHFFSLHAKSVVPFRFPSIFASQDELRSFLERNHAAFANDLEKISGRVQMEAHISAPAPKAEFSTGTDYLRARQMLSHQIEDLLVALKNVAGEAAPSIRKNQAQDAGCRMYYLLPRESVAAFRAGANQLQAAEGMGCRISGPWPPTEFIDCYPDAEASTGKNVT